jgi:hypothetical protein
MPTSHYNEVHEWYEREAFDSWTSGARRLQDLFESSRGRRIDCQKPRRAGHAPPASMNDLSASASAWRPRATMADDDRVFFK